MQQRCLKILVRTSRPSICLGDFAIIPEHEYKSRGVAKFFVANKHTLKKKILEAVEKMLLQKFT